MAVTSVTLSLFTGKSSRNEEEAATLDNVHVCHLDRAAGNNKTHPSML